MCVYFEIAALFPSPYSRVKNAAFSKQTFIWTPSSRSYIIFALVTVQFHFLAVARRQIFPADRLAYLARLARVPVARYISYGQSCFYYICFEL